ncbi:hypothetical protein [Psychroserpens sp.]
MKISSANNRSPYWSNNGVMHQARVKNNQWYKLMSFIRNNRGEYDTY